MVKKTAWILICFAAFVVGAFINEWTHSQDLKAGVQKCEEATALTQKQNNLALKSIEHGAGEKKALDGQIKCFTRFKSHLATCGRPEEETEQVEQQLTYLQQQLSELVESRYADAELMYDAALTRCPCLIQNEGGLK